MTNPTIHSAGVSRRHVAAWVLVLAGAAAVALSQAHILPPMVCFGVLMAGLVALGAGILAALPARWRRGRRATVEAPAGALARSRG